MSVNQNKSVVTTVAVLLLTVMTPAWAQTIEQLTPHNVSVTAVTYNDRKAVRVMGTPDASNSDSYAVVRSTTLRDGTIEANVAGRPAAGAGAGARGFIGIAFRMQGEQYEYIYLRPTNGRADDQVRRNHSTQYGSYPDFDYARLRREAPEKYESYVDLQPGVWTKVKIEVDGRAARLYVNGAEQPCLIVNDLKLEPREGGVALWVGPGTEGYFSDLKVTPKTPVSPTDASAQILSRADENRANGIGACCHVSTNARHRVFSPLVLPVACSGTNRPPAPCSGFLANTICSLFYDPRQIPGGP